MWTKNHYLYWDNLNKESIYLAERMNDCWRALTCLVIFIYLTNSNYPGAANVEFTSCELNACHWLSHSRVLTANKFHQLVNTVVSRWYPTGAARNSFAKRLKRTAETTTWPSLLWISCWARIKVCFQTILTRNQDRWDSLLHKSTYVLRRGSDGIRYTHDQSFLMSHMIVESIEELCKPVGKPLEMQFEKFAERRENDQRNTFLQQRPWHCKKSLTE